MSPEARPSPPSVDRSRMKLLIAGPLAAVAVLGLGAAGVARLPGGGGAAAIMGEGLRIEVVQPPAPEIDPGGRMDVGELVDGYQHVSLRQSDSGDRFDDYYADAWLEPLPPLPEPPRWRREAQAVERAAAEVRPTAWQPAMEERPEPANPYGFDAPGPDYRAERRARREHMARLEARRAAARVYSEGGVVWRSVPSYGPPPRLERDTAFY